MMYYKYKNTWCSKLRIGFFSIEKTYCNPGSIECDPGSFECDPGSIEKAAKAAKGGCEKLPPTA